LYSTQFYIELIETSSDFYPSFEIIVSLNFFIGSSNYTLATTWYCLKHYLLMVVMEWVLGMQINNTNE
jgi:hypothetical protein